MPHPFTDDSGAGPAAAGTTQPTDALSETLQPTGVLAMVDLMLKSARETAPELGPKELVDAIVARAHDVMPNVDWASVTVVDRGAPSTLTASDDTAVRIDTIQYEIGSGPCIDAILDDHVYVTGNLREDTRWPEFGHRAATEVGVSSMLAFRLVLLDESRAIAGLNLYSSTPDAFDEAAVRQGTLLATQCSLVVTAYLASREADNLSRALRTNREIGVAMGVLMARHGITRDQAFGLLRMASQDSNRKLFDIAVDVADAGELPLRRLGPKRDLSGPPASPGSAGIEHARPQA